MQLFISLKLLVCLRLASPLSETWVAFAYRVIKSCGGSFSQIGVRLITHSEITGSTCRPYVTSTRGLQEPESLNYMLHLNIQDHYLLGHTSLTVPIGIPEKHKPAAMNISLLQHLVQF